MSIRIIIAPPAGGKTAHCTRKVHEIYDQAKLQPIHVIVPDSLQKSEWRNRLASEIGHSGFIGISVTTFNGFAQMILEQSGDRRPVLEEHLNMLCVEEAIGRSKLLRYDPIRTKEGFVSELVSTFNEFLLSDLHPEVIRATADTPERQDVLEIFENYLAVLREHQWLSSSFVITAAGEVLQNGFAGLEDCPLLVVDGFDEFQKSQLQLLRMLSAEIPEIIITLPGEKDNDRFAFEPFRDALKEVKDVLSSAEVEYLADVHRQAPEIETVMRNIFEADQEKVAENTGALEILRASSQMEEVRESLRKIKALIVRDQIRADECALFVPGVDAYRPMLRSAAEEMGIPLYFPKHNMLAEEPGVAALKSLLTLSVNAFRPKQLLGLLRSPFMDERFETDEVEALDTIARKMTIVEGREQWEDTLNYLVANDYEKGFMDADGVYIRSIRGLPAREKIMDLPAELKNFFDQVTPDSRTHSRKEWAEWVLTAAQDLLAKAPEIADGINWVLDRMVRYEEMLNQSPLDYSGFLKAFFGLTDRVTVEKEDYIRSDCVMVGDITWARGKRFKAAALLGFSEKLFPKASHEDLILTEAWRSELRLRETRGQVGLLLQALSRADEKLLITRPFLTDTGDEWEQSIFWEQIRTILSIDEEKEAPTIRGGNSRALSDAASGDELLFWTVRYGHSQPPADPPEISERLRGCQAHAESLKDTECGQYFEEDRTGLQNDLESVIDSAIHSASAVKTYNACPFNYFLTALLKLEGHERTTLGMDPRQSGSLKHDILKETFDPEYGVVDTEDVKAVKEQLEKVCDRILAGAPRKYLFRESSLWKFEKNWIRRDMRETIDAMYGDKGLMDGSWQFSAGELRFGFPPKDPVMIPLPDGTEIPLKGIIDRIDRLDEKHWRVVDYKSSKSGCSKEDQVQLVIYANALLAIHPEMEYCDICFWNLKDNKIELPERLAVSELEPDIEAFAAFSEGLRNACFPAGQTDSSKSCYESCPASQWCPLYKKGIF